MAEKQPGPQLRTAGGIQYELTRKRVKNLNIRVREDGTVAVSIPLRTSAEAADRFVAARADWVQQASVGTRFSCCAICSRAMRARVFFSAPACSLAVKLSRVSWIWLR